MFLVLPLFLFLASQTQSDVLTLSVLVKIDGSESKHEIKHFRLHKHVSCLCALHLPLDSLVLLTNQNAMWVGEGHEAVGFASVDDLIAFVSMLTLHILDCDMFSYMLEYSSTRF